MSTAGIYNYRPKVQHPDRIFHQMEGDNLQPPFFFGGAQTPTALGVSIGRGLRNDKYISSSELRKHCDVKGRGINTHYEHTEKIIIPKNYKRI